MIADRARFRHAKKLERLAGYRLPELAFSGNMLETLCSRLNYDALDFAVREQILAFFNDFLRCDCRDSPLCGCPEKKFARKVIELRENGLDHRQIAAFMLDEYGIEVFPADILSFLEESVHVLEAISDVARLQGRDGLAKKTDDHHPPDRAVTVPSSERRMFSPRTSHRPPFSPWSLLHSTGDNRSSPHTGIAGETKGGFPCRSMHDCSGGRSRGSSYTGIP